MFIVLLIDLVIINAIRHAYEVMLWTSMLNIEHKIHASWSFLQCFLRQTLSFRKSMSTVDNVFVLHGLITHMLNGRKRLYCAFIIFTKAFDYVVRDMLWYKLIKLGVRGQILKVIKSMYENIMSRVKSHNELSDELV